MNKKNFAFIICLFAAYLAIAVLFTWPLAKNITTHGFGVDEDSPYHIWHNWWLKYSIFDLKQSPLYTNYIFYPQTIPLAFDANAFVFGALTIPIQFLTGNVVFASNIVFLFSFALSGMGMYLLAFHFCQSKLASSIAGTMYAFAPYVFAQAISGHTNLTSIWILPFFALALENLWQASRGKDIQKKKIIFLISVTGLLIALQAYNDLTYTAFLIFFTGIYATGKVAFKIIKKTKLKEIVKPLINLAIAGILSLLFFIPVLIPTLKTYQSGLKPDADLKTQAVWSADIMSFLRPPNFLKIFPNNWQFTAKQGTVEATVFTGYLPIILSVVVLALMIKGKLKEEREILIIWLLVSACFFVFSLGPWLKFNNLTPTITLFKKAIPIFLPYTLLHKVPIIGGTQEPTRMNPFLMISLCVTSAIVIKELINKLKGGKKYPIATFLAALSIFAVGERLPSNFPITNLTAPEIYKQIAQDKEEFSVLILPVGFNSGQIALGQSPIGSLQFWQVIHKHPSFRGTVARLPAQNFDYYRELPLFKYLITPSSEPDSDDLNTELVRKVFKEQLKIKYLVIHLDKYKKIPLGKTIELIEEVLGAKLLSAEGEIVTYEI